MKKFKTRDWVNKMRSKEDRKGQIIKRNGGRRRRRRNGQSREAYLIGFTRNWFSVFILRQWHLLLRFVFALLSSFIFFPYLFFQIFSVNINCNALLYMHVFLSTFSMCKCVYVHIGKIILFLFIMISIIMVTRMACITVYEYFYSI